MRIPLAIYTAIEGYAWQPGTELPIGFLNEAKKAIGKFPDSSRDNLPFGGAVLVGDQLVVCRYHLARGIDSFGRDALYVVLGAIPRADAARVNVKALLDHPTFAEPHKPLPEMTVDYEGPASDPFPQGFAAGFSQSFDFAESLPWLGDLAAIRKGTLRVACSPATELLPRLDVAYEPPPPPPVRTHVDDFGSRSDNGSGLANSTDVPRLKSSFQLGLYVLIFSLLVIAIVMCAFRIGRSQCKHGHVSIPHQLGIAVETTPASAKNVQPKTNERRNGLWRFFTGRKDDGRDVRRER